MWPSERNQSEKAVYHVISTLWHSGKGRTISGGSDSKESACNMGDPGSTPGSGRSPREGNGNPLQYSCLENSMDRGAWQDAVHGAAKSMDTTEWLTQHISALGPGGGGGLMAKSQWQGRLMTVIQIWPSEDARNLHAWTWVGCTYGGRSGRVVSPHAVLQHPEYFVQDKERMGATGKLQYSGMGL